jgi:N,N'-diacetyllegionaminate synthase
MRDHTLIIAEAGVNHDGDIVKAMRLVDVAADAGADYVKFQTFSADRLVTRQAAKADYQVAAIGMAETQFEMLQRLELSAEDHERIAAHCVLRGVGFLSTGFDQDSVDFLVSMGVGVLKIPSGELTNLPYLRHIGRLDKPIILSTGMATLAEVGEAIEALELAGAQRSSITALHCTTEYPAAIDDVNLRAMLTLRDAFGVAIGYSDHTLGIEVPIAAVAMGATVIEKHFTLDSTLPGPDHRASLEPDQLKAMVAAIRNVEQALGDGLKVPRPVEEKNKQVARKSLVAASPISAGEIFSATNLAVKRPGTGLSPMRWDEVVGKRAVRDFAQDELIEL